MIEGSGLFSCADRSALGVVSFKFLSSIGRLF